ncbi:MAG TPA: LPS export ABC transporter periplasmic protein LptC, partial [Candidatus Eisenbacteria bacterium]
VHGLSKPVREARLDAWLDAHRASLGSRTIKVGTMSGAREAHRVLTAGGVLGLLIDHRVRSGGRWIDFFGRPSRFATGPARLAIATGASMLPIVIRRRSDGGHRVVVGAALASAATGSPASRADSLLEAAVRALEAMIRIDPASWAWMHPRWGRPSQVPAGAAASVARELSSAARMVAMWTALAILSTGVQSCGSKPDGNTAPPAVGEPSSMLSGVTLRETLDGRLRWALKADSSETFTQPNRTVASNIHVDFYDEAGQPSSFLTADEGVVQRSNNDMTARGHVVVITTKGDTLTTERLDWSSVQNRVKTDLPFRLGRPDGVFTGVGFESDPDLTHYTTQQVKIDARDATDDAPR